jgi:hypothetical protein
VVPFPHLDGAVQVAGRPRAAAETHDSREPLRRTGPQFEVVDQRLQRLDRILEHPSGLEGLGQPLADVEMELGE